MGISGLLPLLRSIQKPCSLKKFAGQTIGIDAYGWLHRGTVACAIELALEKPTTKFVDFAVGRVRMLLDFGITPYLVFDGDNLPSKAGTTLERRRKRDESKRLGMEMYKAGKMSQAQQELQKAVDVTPYMARQLIEELKRLNVQYVVAPYEADAQLAYLEQQGIINGILSEDSDLLVFGAKCLLTKLNQYGECVEINRADFASCKEVSLAGWTDAMFRQMAILSGCDYLPNINKMGLKTAYRYVRKYKDAEKVLRMIQFEGQLTVPAEYCHNFQKAELTFLHHRVFCPIAQKLVFLTDLEPGLRESDLPFLGQDVDAETAIGVACGDLDPKTKEPIQIKGRTSPARPRFGEQRRQTLASPADLKSSKSIDSFFKSHRPPLAELDPNSLTPSPSQRRLLQIHANASWEMRTVSSAPQLRQNVVPGVTSSGSARSVQSANRTAFLARASAISVFQPPKRQRLCADTESAPLSPRTQHSPFFAQPPVEPSPLSRKTEKAKKARKSDFDVWSDDSVDDILLGLPDIQRAVTPDQETRSATDDHLRARNANSDDVWHTVPQSSPLLAQQTPERSLDTKTQTCPLNAPQIAAMASVDLDRNTAPVADASSFGEAVERKALLQNFVSWSPPRPSAALASLDASDPAATIKSYGDETSEFRTAASGTEHCSSTTSVDLARTFSYQSSAGQIAALRSLSPRTLDRKMKLGTTARKSCDNEQPPSGRRTCSLQPPDQPPFKNPSSNAQVDGEAKRTPGVEAEVKESVWETEIDAVVGPCDFASNAGPSRTTHSRPKGSEDHIVPDSEDEGSEEDGSTPPKRTIDLKAYAFTMT